MTNKVICMLSGGKDSMATYLKLLESFDKKDILPIMIQRSAGYLADWTDQKDIFVNNRYRFENLTPIKPSENEKYYTTFEHKLLDVGIDTSDYYFSTGELDILYEIINTYPVVELLDCKGFISPFMGKPRDLMFEYLKKYNCEFVITGIWKNNEPKEYIGKRITAVELEEVYRKPREFGIDVYKIQTLAVRCDGLIEASEEEIETLINDIKNVR